MKDNICHLLLQIFSSQFLHVQYSSFFSLTYSHKGLCNLLMRMLTVPPWHARKGHEPSDIQPHLQRYVFVNDKKNS
jgi:hypothetical protein